MTGVKKHQQDTVRNLKDFNKYNNVSVLFVNKQLKQSELLIKHYT